ncbi:MAG: hypothetical protein JWO50_513 [Candidatus Kaiserbacteria bacterium]|nr:hypothetical protein [Candidatus Kaiserbacteria bacterium]
MNSITFSTEELIIISAAIRETLEELDINEFQTRTGFNPDKFEELYKKIDECIQG